MMAKDKSKTKISARTSPVVSKPKSTIAKTRGWSLDVPSATTTTTTIGKKGKGKGKEPMRRSTMPAQLMECVDELIGDGRRGDVVIPVIGKTGVGRSTFINTLLDSPLMRVAPSGSCFPCTTSLAYVQLDPSLHPNLPGRRVFIVDTPGLDEVGEDGLLLRLKTWLEKSYWKGMKLGGVIYLHHICERLVVGKMNRVMDEVDGRMVLATSGWDEIVDVETGDGLTVGLGFERELRDVWCRDLIGGLSGSEEDPPSNMKRFWLSKGSAVEILNIILLSIPPLDVEGFTGGGGKRKGVPMKRFKSVWAPSVLVA